MLFPTFTFAVFLLIVMPLSWLTMPNTARWRRVMIVASYVFYAWWGTNAAASGGSRTRDPRTER